MRSDHAGVQFGNIQQGVEHAVDGFDGFLDLADQRFGFHVADAVRQIGEKQAQRVNRLTQVVTGGREKPSFCGIGLFRPLSGRIQYFLASLEFADVGIGQNPATVGHVRLQDFDDRAIRAPVLHRARSSQCYRRIGGVQHLTQRLAGVGGPVVQPEQA